MARTDNFRRQHEKMIGIAAEIDGLAAKPIDSAGAAAIRAKLSELVGNLKFHLASEDEVLYPTLLKQPDPRTAETADRFMKEMGRIGATLADLNSKWTAAYIQENRAFKAEWDSMLGALADRIKRENSELYPLADKIA